MWGAVRSYLARFLGQTGRPPSAAGRAVGGDREVSPGYPTMSSMSAIAAFPWVRAAVGAISSDLAGLPLIAVQILPDGREERVLRHPALELLRRPNPWQTGREFRSQLYTDFALPRNAYVWRSGPRELIRLHPARVKPLADADGLVTGYRYGQMLLDYEDVLHVSDVSWADNVTEVLGESVIRTLHDALTASKAAREQVARVAKRGQPTLLVRPPPIDTLGVFGTEQVERISEALEDQLRTGKAALVLGAAMETDVLSITPRDMEFQALQESVMYEILAVLDVPATRVGVPGANHGTAKTELRRYWEGLRSKAALFDDAFTALISTPGIEIRHDFSKVEALQVSYTERAAQMKAFVEVGARPYDAAVYVGFVDPPLDVDAEPRSSQLTPKPAQEPEEPQGTRTVADVLACSRDRYARALRLGMHTDLRFADLEDLEPLLGLDQAAAVAERIFAAVSSHLATCREDGTEPYLRGVSVFSPHYAAALAAHREAA